MPNVGDLFYADYAGGDGACLTWNGSAWVPLGHATLDANQLAIGTEIRHEPLGTAACQDTRLTPTKLDAAISWPSAPPLPPWPQVHRAPELPWVEPPPSDAEIAEAIESIRRSALDSDGRLDP